MGERSLSKKSKGQDPFSSLPAHGDQGLGARLVTSCTSSACVSWNLRGEESFLCTELRDLEPDLFWAWSASGAPRCSTAHPCPISPAYACPPPALQVLTAHGPRPPSCSWQTGRWCPWRKRLDPWPSDLWSCLCRAGCKHSPPRPSRHGQATPASGSAAAPGARRTVRPEPGPLIQKAALQGPTH